MQHSASYSKLLKYKVFTRKRKTILVSDLPNLIIEAQQKSCRLLVLSVEERADFEAIHLPQAKLLFVEETVCLHQKLGKRIAIRKDKNIVLCNRKLNLLKNQSLTSKSKWSSRFCLDANFDELDWEKHRNQQIKKATAIFIYGSLEDLQGYIVLTIRKQNLSVNALEFEDTIIAKALLKRGQQYAKENELESLQIEIPRANKKLGDFLKESKFKEQEVRFIYHLWMK